MTELRRWILSLALVAGAVFAWAMDSRKPVPGPVPPEPLAL